MLIRGVDGEFAEVWHCVRLGKLAAFFPVAPSYPTGIPRGHLSIALQTGVSIVKSAFLPFR